MRTIFKYELRSEDIQEVLMPHMAEVLSIQAQGNDIYLWALVDPSKEKVKHTFFCFGTGQPIPETQYDVPKKHIATVQQGTFVWHFFVWDFPKSEDM